MLKEMFGYSVIFIFLLLPSNLFSMNLQTACNSLNLPRECQCQRTRHRPIFSSNETHLRCRQLTEITTNHRWSNISYDRLIFETFYDNLTLHRFVFADTIVRTLRFNVQNLFLNDHTFENAYIGQLAISHHDTYGRIHFETNGQIFYGTTITNLNFKLIDFQTPISEIIFSNAKIYSFLIQSSKFYGFTNKNVETISKTITKLKSDEFLDYESLLPINLTTIQLNSTNESSSIEPEQMIPMNTTSITYPIYIKIYTIISSINTTNLTENYFPNNLEYNQLEEIELSFNQITSLDAHVFRHLKQFQGRLILLNNQIRYINPYALTDLFLLKNLSLANNFIQDLSSIHFQNLTQLYELDLSFNQITKLNDNIFEYLYNLQILHLNFNPLEFIHSDAFENLTQLKQIDFQGVQFIHLIDQEYFQWILNLASLHVIHLIKTDFDLSDVAFCILSRYNRTLFHLSRQDSCSCNIHYFNRNHDLAENNSISISQYDTNYLRLTPICNENDIESIVEQNENKDDLILRNLEDKCDYKLMYIDCDAMTTTTTMEMTTLLDIGTANRSNLDIRLSLTNEIPVTTIRSILHEQTPEGPLNNMKKLFTVLGTLVAITIGAIILVFFWYRFKAMLRRRKKKKKFIENQRHFNSPAVNSHHSSAPRYASVDMLGSIHSAYLFDNKNQCEALIESPQAIYKNIEAIENNRIENFIDDESLQQDLSEDKTTKIPAITQC